MKFACNKCKTIFTNDIRPVKVKRDQQGYITNLYDVYYKVVNKYYDSEEDEKVYGNFRKGIFYLSKGYTCNNDISADECPSQIGKYFRVIKKPSEYIMSAEDLVEGTIPPNPKNCCCNWSSHLFECKSCGEYLGLLHLDCYEDYSVSLNVKKVERVYGK